MKRLREVAGNRCRTHERATRGVRRLGARLGGDGPPAACLALTGVTLALYVRWPAAIGFTEKCTSRLAPRSQIFARNGCLTRRYGYMSKTKQLVRYHSDEACAAASRCRMLRKPAGPETINDPAACVREARGRIRAPHARCELRRNCANPGGRQPQQRSPAIPSSFE